MIQVTRWKNNAHPPRTLNPGQGRITAAALKLHVSPRYLFPRLTARVLRVELGGAETANTLRYIMVNPDGLGGRLNESKKAHRL